MAKSGIYWTFNVFKRIVYVGQTRNFENRKARHKSIHDVGLSERLGLETWGFRPVANIIAKSRLEKEMIRRHRPILNKNGGGTTGRPRA